MDRKSFLSASGLTIVSLSLPKVVKADEQPQWYSLPEQILQPDRLGMDELARYESYGDRVTLVSALNKGAVNLIGEHSFLCPTFNRRTVDENRVFVELARRSTGLGIKMKTDEVYPMMNSGFVALERNRLCCAVIVAGPTIGWRMKQSGILNKSKNPHAFGVAWTATVFLTDYLPHNGALFFAAPEFVGVMPIRQPDENEIGMAIVNPGSLVYVQSA